MHSEAEEGPTKYEAPQFSNYIGARIDGEKLCTTSNMSPAEECSVYPAGKKSGDSFDVTGAQGTATIKIK